MKMTVRDIAGYLGINTKTIYNWKKDRPNLYKTVMLRLMVEEIIEKSEKSLEELKEIIEILFKIRRKNLTNSKDFD